MPAKRRDPNERQPNTALFPNRHRNKLEVILNKFDLPQGKWKKGMACVVEMYATGPVGVVVWLCTHDYGWAGGPTTTRRYVMGRITKSKMLPKPPGASTTSKYFRTEFVLIEDGPNHTERG